MTLAPCENLKGFASTRPPLVVFMICLGLFAGILLSIAYYVKVHELQNPDISQDWNVFLKSFAELEFCVLGNSSETAAPAASTATAKSAVMSTPASTSDLGVTHADDGPRNYSVSLLLSIQPTLEFLTHHHNITHVSGTISGNELGLKGEAADEMINITAELPYEWNNTKCSTGPSGCEHVQIYTCVHFSASNIVFPTSKNPPTCEGLNETGLEYHARVKAQKSKQFVTYYCRSRPIIKVDYKFNPSLAVWLSFHDRSVINLHLMHTSYFLFVMVMTLFCYALIRGHSSKNKHSQTAASASEKELLSSSNQV